jgi:ATP-dependent Clp protease ATP-binding subunit ClpB
VHPASVKGGSLKPNDEVLTYLGEQGLDPQFGARPPQRVIFNELSRDVVVGAVLEYGAV